MAQAPLARLPHEQRRRAALMDQLTAYARERLEANGNEALEAFFREYYRAVPMPELEARELADLYGAALAHWGFARGRQPAEGFKYPGKRLRKYHVRNGIFDRAEQN